MANLKSLHSTSAKWGVSIEMLLYRMRTFGTYSDRSIETARRNLPQLRHLIAPPLLQESPQEFPRHLRAAAAAYDRKHGTSALARKLCWPDEHMEHVLGIKDERPIIA